jgi:uncharacterized protein (TIRG00374 family)
MSTSSLIRRLIAGLIFGFLVILGLALFSDIREVSGKIVKFNWQLYLIVLGLTLTNYLLRGFKFHYYLRLIGANDINVRESFRLFVAGFPLAVTPGKVGEALKGVWIHNFTGIPTAKGIAVVAAERISDGLAVLALSSLGVIAYPQYWPAFAVVLIGLSGIVFVSQIRPIALFCFDLAARLRFLGKLIQSLREFYEGSYILFKPGATLVAVGLGILSWLGEGVGFYLILIGLGLDPSANTFGTAVFILAFSTVIGAVSALPGGLGAAEASISGMLILLLATSADIAAAGTLLIRFATLWFGVALGLTVWVMSRNLFGFEFSSKKYNEATHENH